MKRPHNKTSLLLLALLLSWQCCCCIAHNYQYHSCSGYTDGKTITVTITGSNFGEEEGMSGSRCPVRLTSIIIQSRRGQHLDRMQV